MKLADGQVAVTCLDEEGREETQIVGRDDYVIVTTGRLYLADIQVFPTTGTKVLTLKLLQEDSAS